MSTAAKADNTNQLGDDVLIARLRDKYTVLPPLPCTMCGGELTLVHDGSRGEERVWACEGIEDHPENHGRMRFLPGRFIGDEHFDKSRWVQHQVGDALVVELITRYLRKG